MLRLIYINVLVNQFKNSLPKTFTESIIYPVMMTKTKSSD